MLQNSLRQVIAQIPNKSTFLRHSLRLQHQFCNYDHPNVQNDYSYRPNNLKYVKTYIIKSSLFGGPVVMLH